MRHEIVAVVAAAVRATHSVCVVLMFEDRRPVLDPCTTLATRPAGGVGDVATPDGHWAVLLVETEGGRSGRIS
jgi:hypothetical protein